MLLRELVQKFVGWDSSTRLHVLETLSYALDERLSGTLPASSGIHK